MIVYHFTDSNGFFGAENLILSLIMEQVEQGLRPKLVSISRIYDSPKEIEIKAIQYGIETIQLKTHSGLNPLSLKFFSKLLRDHHIDIIHSHGYKSDVSLGLLRLVSNKNTPLLATIHGYTSVNHASKNYFYECLDRQLLRNFDAICIVDLSMRQRYFRRLDSSSKKIHFVPNGIRTESQVRINQREKFLNIIDFCNAGFTIGSIGRFSNEKNYHSLIKAFHFFSQKIENARLILIGDGPLNASLRNAVDSHSANQNIMLAGYIDHASDYIPYFDIFSLCSLTEGLPMVILEALLAETPILATRVGSNPFVLKNVKSALLIDNHDEKAIYKGLNTIHSNYNYFQSGVSEGRRIALSKYSISKTAQAYYSIYKTLI